MINCSCRWLTTLCAGRVNDGSGYRPIEGLGAGAAPKACGRISVQRGPQATYLVCLSFRSVARISVLTVAKKS